MIGLVVRQQGHEVMWLAFSTMHVGQIHFEAVVVANRALSGACVVTGAVDGTTVASGLLRASRTLPCFNCVTWPAPGLLDAGTSFLFAVP